jgi:hypothetical protein
MTLSLRRQVFASLRPYRAMFGFALAQVVLIGGAELLKPWPLKLIIDNVLGGQRLSWPLVADWSRDCVRLPSLSALVKDLLGDLRGQNVQSHNACQDEKGGDRRRRKPKELSQGSIREDQRDASTQQRGE